MLLGGRVYQSNTDTTVYCRDDVQPPTTDYDVSASLYFASGSGSPSVGVCGRMAGPGGAALTFYQARIVNNGSGIVLARFINGATVTLSSVAYSAPAGAEPKLVLRMKGDQLSVLLDGVVVVGPITDSNITAAGYAGIRMASASGNQIRIDNFAVEPIEESAAAIVASLSATLEPVAIGSATQAYVAGALSKVLDSAALASASALASTAGLAKTLAPAVLAASGYIEAEPPQQDGVEGTLSKTLIGAALAASATLAVRGALAATLDGAILASTTATPIAAALTRALEPALLAATATRPMAAQLEATLGDAALSAAFRIYLLGTVRAPAGAGYAPQRAAVTARPAQTGGHRPPVTQETTR